MTKVAVGIIFLRGGPSILLCQRPKDKPYPLKWEFPGGKVEEDENIEVCLKRELQEELDIDAEVGDLYYRQRYLYPDSGTYDVFYHLVPSFVGEPVNKVFADVRWVQVGELKQYEILEGNRNVVEKLVNDEAAFCGKQHAALQHRSIVPCRPARPQRTIREDSTRMTTKATSLALDELWLLHREKYDALRQRLDDFARISPDEYFYELAYCLLTPQSSAVNADKAIRFLRSRDFFHSNVDPERLLHQKDFYVRFHKTKAKHLIQLKSEYSSICQKLSSGQSGEQIREWLVQNVMGLGWKEASHFLRNIGYRNLAILDRHILRSLIRLGVLRCLPKTLSPKVYKQIERKFRTFAEHIGIPMDELDLLFWSMETGEILK